MQRPESDLEGIYYSISKQILSVPTLPPKKIPQDTSYLIPFLPLKAPYVIKVLCV